MAFGSRLVVASGVVSVALGVVGLSRWAGSTSDPLAPGDGVSVAEIAAQTPASGPAAGGLQASGAGGSGSTGGALEAVRAAAQDTEAESTAGFTLTVALLDEGGSSPLTEVTGVADLASGAVALALRQWDPASSAAPSRLEVVGVDDELYVRAPSLDPPGAPARWWRTTVAPGGPGEDGAPAAVSSLVGLVGDAVSAEVIGPLTEDGVGVTRYRVALPADGRVPPGEGDAAGVDPAAGWALVGVTDAGRLRSVEVRASGAWGAAAGRPVVVRLVLEQLGAPVVVTVPDPADVVAVNPSARSGAGG